MIGPAKSLMVPEVCRDGTPMIEREQIYKYRVHRDGTAACTIYVIGVPFSMTEECFCAPFTPIGPVVAVFLGRSGKITNHTIQSQYGACTLSMLRRV